MSIKVIIIRYRIRYRLYIGIVTAPNGWTNPSGGGLHLITDYEVDFYGRPTQRLGPVSTMNLGGTATAMRRAQWTVYQDASFATWRGYGYGTGTGYATYTLINPVRIEQRDAAERVRGQIEAVRAGTSGALSASDTFAQAKMNSQANHSTSSAKK
jgi:hypothetical protein